MSLQNTIENLSEDKQFEIAIKLAKHALSIWDKFSDKNKLVYHDSIIGLKHEVDKNLLEGTLIAIEIYLASKLFNNYIDEQEQLHELYKQFEDPIVALQDDDWDLPDEVLKTFYGVYNLLRATMGNKSMVIGESAIYISINQLVDALTNSGAFTFDSIQAILERIDSEI